jgi:hypothetical protein
MATEQGPLPLPHACANQCYSRVGMDPHRAHRLCKSKSEGGRESEFSVGGGLSGWVDRWERKGKCKKGCR